MISAQGDGTRERVLEGIAGEKSDEPTGTKREENDWMSAALTVTSALAMIYFFLLLPTCFLSRCCYIVRRVSR